MFTHEEIKEAITAIARTGHLPDNDVAANDNLGVYITWFRKNNPLLMSQFANTVKAYYFQSAEEE